MPEPIGTKYPTQIPLYSENADIQTALELYHYGQEGEPETLEPNSIAGHLNNLENTKVDIVPVSIPASANIETDLAYRVTGYYIQSQTSEAIETANGAGYPAINNTFYPGLLKVVNSGSLVFQEYHVIGETGQIINRVYRRVFFNSWSPWEKSVSLDDVTVETDERYYLKNQVYTISGANNAFAPKYFVETSLKTSNYTLVLEDLNKVVNMNVSGGGVLTVPTNTTVAFPVGSVINVYNSNPTEFLEIAGASGVTVRNPGTIEPYQEASLRKRAANEWVAAGPVY